MHLAHRRSRLATEVARLGGSCRREPANVPQYSAIHWVANGWGRELAEPIRSVSLVGSRATDQQVSGIIPLIRALPEVQRISIARSDVTDRQVELLATCIELRRIDLSENAITDDCLGALAQLVNLEELSLAGTAIGDAGALQLQPLPNLAVLDLSFTKITDRSLGAAAGWPKLQQVNLSQTGVTDAGVLSLQRQLPKVQVWVREGSLLISHESLTQSKTFALRGPFFTNAYFECIGDIQFPYTVDLSGSRITAKGLRGAPVGSIGWTRKLSLEGESIDNQSLEAIAAWQNLHELTLRNANISAAGLQHLSKLPRLRRLWLTGSQVADEDLVSLGELCELEFLDLSMTRIEGAGLRHLAGLTKLRRLALVGSTITDDSLGNLPPLPALECLDVDHTAISDRGIEHLKTFPKLWEVNSRRTAFSAATRRILHLTAAPRSGRATI